jgi:predicted NUDIX family NTP pyrophosphohydrolase
VAHLAEGDLDTDRISSNTFELEWPPRSGTMQEFPEVDEAGWFDLDTARTKLHKGQVGLVDLVAGALSDVEGG